MDRAVVQEIPGRGIQGREIRARGVRGQVSLPAEDRVGRRAVANVRLAVAASVGWVQIAPDLALITPAIDTRKAVEPAWAKWDRSPVKDHTDAIAVPGRRRSCWVATRACEQISEAARDVRHHRPAFDNDCGNNQSACST